MSANIKHCLFYLCCQLGWSKENVNLVITPQAICVKKSQFFRSLYCKTNTPDAEGQNLFDVKGSEGLFLVKNNVSRCITFSSM